MHCWDAAIIGQRLCLAHLQRNLYFGSTMSQKVKNQMKTLCLSFQYEGPSLITERTKPAHLWISAPSPALPQVRRSERLNSPNSLDAKAGLACLPHGVSYFSASFYGMLFYFICRNIHNDERMNISAFKTRTGWCINHNVRLKSPCGRRQDDLLTADAEQTVIGQEVEFVCCFSHDSLIRLLSDHLCPKGKAILSSCPFTLQREQADISAAENIKLSPSWRTSISVSVLTLQHGD